MLLIHMGKICLAHNCKHYVHYKECLWEIIAVDYVSYRQYRIELLDSSLGLRFESAQFESIIEGDMKFWQRCCRNCSSSKILYGVFWMKFFWRFGRLLRFHLTFCNTPRKGGLTVTFLGFLFPPGMLCDITVKWAVIDSSMSFSGYPFEA